MNQLAPTDFTEVDGAIRAATDAILAQQRPDGHWVYELEADATIPAEYVLLVHYLAEEPNLELERKIGVYLRRIQGAHGGWPLYHEGAFDILGLGAGTAVQELALLLQLKTLTDGRLFLLDVSQPLLVSAGHNASLRLPRESQIPVIGVLGNFHQLPAYSYLFESRAPRKRVVTMFGYTFGNLANEVRFVRSALSWLNRGDYLLLDVARAMAPADRPDMLRKAEPLLSARRSSPWVQQVEEFLTGPIVRYGKGISGIQVEAHLDVHSCVVPGSYALEMMATVQSEGHLPRRFSIGHTKRYDVEALKDCLRKEDWHMIEHWPYADDRCMLCLFERGTVKPKRSRKPT